MTRGSQRQPPGQPPNALALEWVVVDTPYASSIVNVRICVHCHQPYAGGDTSKFCSHSCRTLNNRLKWESAGGAVFTRVCELTNGVSPTEKQIGLALEWMGAKRRARLMSAFSLTWDVEAREWRLV